MMSDEDELYIKVVVRDKTCNFVAHNFLFKIGFMPKYASQDFIE
jgi:hypothetical protein